MTSWLNKQKKQALIELTSEAGLKPDEDLRKDEIIELLDDYLQKNATRLSQKLAFEPYYGTRRTPFKPRPSSAAGLTSDDGEVKSVVKARGRRPTKVKSESDEDGLNTSPSQALVSSSSALATRTPARPRRSELPASPADVADEMEHAARRMSASIDHFYVDSGIPGAIDSLREKCSSITGVQMTFLLLEGLAMSRGLFFGYVASDAKPFHAFGFEIPVSWVSLPDLFQLVSPEFWKPTLLWSATSFFIPLLFAYFYNLSTHDIRRGGTRVSVARYPADPLMFNVVKAILTLVVYGNHYTFGLVHPFYVDKVNACIYGGHQGMMAGSYVGIIAALYEAAQRK